MCKVFLCISSYSKTLISRRIIYALFSQPVVGFWGRSAQGAQTPTVAPSPGASPGKSVWGHSKQVEGHTGSRRRRRRGVRGNGNGEGVSARRTPLGIRITGRIFTFNTSQRVSHAHLPSMPSALAHCLRCQVGLLFSVNLQTG